MLTCGPLVIELEQVTVRLNGSEIPVTFQEFKLLVSLAMRQGQVVPRDALLARAWPQGQMVSPRAVDVHIRRLRRKLQDRGSRMIETVYRRGYRLVVAGRAAGAPGRRDPATR